MDLLVTLTTRQGVAQLNSTQASDAPAAHAERASSRAAGCRRAAGCLRLAAARCACAVLPAPAHVCLLHPPPPQDYSFLETPELPVETNSTIIPRRALPNPRIPATLNGTLVWGAPPPAVPLAGNATALVNGVAGNLTSAAAANASAAGASNGTAAPPGLPAGITCEPTSNGQGQNCGCVGLPQRCGGGAALLLPPLLLPLLPPWAPLCPQRWAEVWPSHWSVHRRPAHPPSNRPPTHPPPVPCPVAAWWRSTAAAAPNPWIHSSQRARRRCRPPPSPTASRPWRQVGGLAGGVVRGGQVGCAAWLGPDSSAAACAGLLAIPSVLDITSLARALLYPGPALAAGEPGAEGPPLIAPPGGPTPANVSSQEQPPSGGGGGGGGMVAGIAGGVAAALALAAAAAFILLRRRRARRQAADSKARASQAALAAAADHSEAGYNGKGGTPRSSDGGPGGVPLGSAYKGGGGPLVEVVVPGRPRAAWGDLSGGLWEGRRPKGGWGHSRWCHLFISSLRLQGRLAGCRQGKLISALTSPARNLGLAPLVLRLALALGLPSLRLTPRPRRAPLAPQTPDPCRAPPARPAPWRRCCARSCRAARAAAAAC